MNAMVIHEAMKHWTHIAPVLKAPTNEEEYQNLVDALDAVLDAGGADERHQLAGMAALLGDLVAEWEDRNLPAPQGATPVEVLKHLMKENNLRQSDLEEIGSQGVVSEILNGKRELNARQIKALVARFGVPAEFFL